METSDDSIKDVYKDINKIDNYFYETNDGNLKVQEKHGSIHEYCHYGDTSGNCNGYFEMTSSGVIHLLKMLKDNHKLEDDQLAEYAILWLIYKLNVQEKNGDMNLNNFYTNYIVKNKCYNDKIKDDPSLTYMKIIDKIKDLMNIEEISKFNGPFSKLLYLYDMDYYDYEVCNRKSVYAKSFASEFENFNNDSNNIEGSLYNKMISTLSDDYNELKKIYHNKNCTSFPPLPEIEPKKNIAQNIVGDRVEDSGKGSEQILGHTSEVTSSSSSISNTLIPGLSVVSVIPVFLGIAYKYSLFGIDKLFQRQYLRTKLKNVKKKMKLNI
ncbi:PIR protein CIR protein [Plasmodium vinckei petteri]|uniref:PIR protein CIR protein n=1 Tax=Plasmodium vinckei petteri TaxID=138298 RepID=A0A6V7T0L7_PLAVN|nr:PIR protein CIR protein [Plasmodium vinckei petteri]